jgi:hypothetical protein
MYSRIYPEWEQTARKSKVWQNYSALLLEYQRYEKTEGNN